MLDAFVSTSNSDGIFLTSYIKPTISRKEYMGTEWVGRSHESDTPGLICHSFSWIQAECAKRGLIPEEIKEKVYNFGDQTWIKIKHETT